MAVLTAGFFAPIPGPTKAQRDAGDVRQFVGDGSKFLKVPGLKSIKAIRIGDVDLPLEQALEFPDNQNKDRKVATSWPMATVTPDADGVPTLLRSPNSNFGKWQDGQPVYIIGDWEQDKSAPAGRQAAK